MLLLWSLPLVSACGNLTAGGLTGEATLVVSGDATEGGSSQVTAPSRISALGAQEGPARASLPSGRVVVTLQAFLEGLDGRLVPLTDGDALVDVDLEGLTEATAGLEALEVGSYPRIKIVFSQIRANVVSGLIVNNVPVVGDIDVTLTGSTLVVERDISLDIAEGRSMEILLDLNSATWLNGVNPELKTVSETVFERALQVRVR